MLRALMFPALVAAGQLYAADEPTHYAPPHVETQHEIEASYTIGVTTEVYVGEQMLRVRDYYVTLNDSGVSSARLSPSEDFKLKIPPFSSVRLTREDVIEVTGSVKRNGIDYRLVKLPATVTQQLRFLIDDTGAFSGSAVNTSGTKMGWSYRAKPNSVRLTPAPAVTSSRKVKGTKNYELVYGGTSGDSYQLLYREYTPDDLARPAFSQSVVYEKSAPTIRFRNLQIEVDAATNEKIRFRVVADGRQ